MGIFSRGLVWLNIDRGLFKTVVRFSIAFLFTNIILPSIINGYRIYHDNVEFSILTLLGTNFALFFIVCWFLFVLSELYIIRKDTENRVKSVVDNAIKDADIVLRTDIAEFNPAHIKVMQDIIKGIDIKEKETRKDVKAIYALDASDPKLWWSGSTLGYFAIQARWVSRPERRKVHRFFVLDEASLAGNQVKKFLQLHILMGIETYIIFKRNYNELCDEFTKRDQEKNVIEKKEFLVWDEPETITIVENETGLNLGPLHGFQSLWLVETPFGDREDTFFPDIGGKRPKRAAEWKVKFEFIPYTYKDKALIYHSFSEFLTHQAKTCIDDNAVEDHKSGDLKILHVPFDFEDKNTEYKLMDIDTMNAIFNKYVEFHGTQSK